MDQVSEDREFFDAYDAVELELPNGKTIRCTAPTLEESARLLGLLQKMQIGDMSAMSEFLKEFPKAVGAGKAFNGFLPGELVRVANRFFWQTDRMTTAETPATSDEST